MLVFAHPPKKPLEAPTSIYMKIVKLYFICRHVWKQHLFERLGLSLNFPAWLALKKLKLYLLIACQGFWDLLMIHTNNLYFPSHAILTSVRLQLQIITKAWLWYCVDGYISYCIYRFSIILQIMHMLFNVQFFLL